MTDTGKNFLSTRDRVTSMSVPKPSSKYIVPSKRILKRKFLDESDHENDTNISTGVVSWISVDKFEYFVKYSTFNSENLNH